MILYLSPWVLTITDSFMLSAVGLTSVVCHRSANCDRFSIKKKSASVDQHHKTNRLSSQKANYPTCWSWNLDVSEASCRTSHQPCEIKTLMLFLARTDILHLWGWIRVTPCSLNPSYCLIFYTKCRRKCVTALIKTPKSDWKINLFNITGCDSWAHPVPITVQERHKNTCT